MATKAQVQRIANYYKEQFHHYENAVLTGKRSASKAEMAKVMRQKHDLENGVEGFHFDLLKGLRPLVWIALNLVYPLGAKRGKAMKLSDWQAWDTAVLFGWVSDETGNRRFADAFIEVARKNGKSVYAGALLDYLAFGEIDGAQCYVAATSKEQAGECFDRAGKALKLAKGASVSFYSSQNYKAIKWKSGTIMAIAAEPKDGKLAYASVIDEYHQHKTNALVDSISSGNVSDQQALLLRITTAGTNINGVCHEEYKTCKKILSGESIVPSYFVSIYEVEEDDDPEDVRTWEKANPNLGISVDIEKLESQWTKAKLTAAGRTTFLTKNLNKWCFSTQKWAKMDKWMELCHWTVDERSLNGRVCYGGLDLSSVSDFTAFTLDFPMDDGTHVQISHFWIADAMKESIAAAVRCAYRQMDTGGMGNSHSWEVIDYDYVRDYLNECYTRYNLLFIGADRWRLSDLEHIMPPWFVDVAYEFGQGMKSMSPSIEFFERTYLEGNVTANGNEVIDWMMSCADIKQDPSGNVKLVKPQRAKSEARIDGVITSVMALDVARAQGELYISDDEIEKMVSFTR